MLLVAELFGTIREKLYGMTEKTETGATTTTPSSYTGKARENLPDFSGRAIDYKEYRKRLLLYEKKRWTWRTVEKRRPST